MKKTYKNPTLTVVNVQTARILTGSNPQYYDTPTTSKTSGNHGRGGSFSGWTEEEE